MIGAKISISSGVGDTRSSAIIDWMEEIGLQVLDRQNLRLAAGTAPATFKPESLQPMQLAGVFPEKPVLISLNASTTQYIRINPPGCFFGVNFTSANSNGITVTNAATYDTANRVDILIAGDIAP